MKTDKNWLRRDILAAFRKSGLSRFAWARQAVVDYSAVHGFVAGQRDVTLATASKLCRVLGLELRAGEPVASRRTGVRRG